MRLIYAEGSGSESLKRRIGLVKRLSLLDLVQLSCFFAFKSDPSRYIPPLMMSLKYVNVQCAILLSDSRTLLYGLVGSNQLYAVKLGMSKEKAGGFPSCFLNI